MAVIPLTGPTCAGKSTVEAELQKLGCGRAISHTTRLPRAGEVNGQHYHFVTDLEYDRLRSEGAFIETIELGTRRYAMSSAALRAALAGNKHVAIVVEPNGARQIVQFCKDNGMKYLAVWLDCNPKEQARRWVARLAADLIGGKESIGAYSERLALMLTEEQQWRNDAHRHALISGSEIEYQAAFHNAENYAPIDLARAILNMANVEINPFMGWRTAANQDRFYESDKRG